MSKRVELKLTQGKTFIHVVRWASPPFIYKAISAITKAAPVVITATAHGIPHGWPVAVISVVGMTEINAERMPPTSREFNKATWIDADRIALNDVDSSQFTAYVSGGYLMYYTPLDLTGYTARMTIRNRFGGTSLVSLTDASGIALDPVLRTITVTISAVQTAALARGYGVYDLELVSPGGIVTEVIHGDVNIEPEVTT